MFHIEDQVKSELREFTGVIRTSEVMDDRYETVLFWDGGESVLLSTDYEELDATRAHIRALKAVTRGEFDYTHAEFTG